MPKRTNAFQRLILAIYEQLSAPGGSITESAMLPERSGGTLREVDILLQSRLFGIDLKIAVECRGRKDRDDVTWIDDLIGKYHDFPVDKVIAVSKSGFSAGAAAKAAAFRIETLTLTKALETNWPAQFAKLGLALLTRQDIPVSVAIATSPAAPLTLTPSTIVFGGDGTPLGGIEGLGQALYRQKLPDIHKAVLENAPRLLKTLQDVKEKRLSLEMTHGLSSPCYVVADDGSTKLYIQTVTVQLQCAFTVELLKVDHYVLGNSQITTATAGPPGQPVSLVAVQSTDKPNQATFRITGQPNWPST